MQPASPPRAAQVVTRLLNLLVVVVMLGVVVVVGLRYYGTRKDDSAPYSAAPVGAAVPGIREGEQAFGQHDWGAAAGYYRIAVEHDKYNGLAWFRLGYSLHALQRLDEAILAHQQAANFPQLRGVALYNLSCALALKGRRDESLTALRDAIHAGFQSDFPITKDPDFASMAKDAEFLPLAELAMRPDSRPRPKVSDPRRLDPALPADWQPPAEIVGS